MQLDTTRIAVRERGMIDTYDLTLHVIRVFGPRLIPALLLGILPFALFNEAILYGRAEPPEAVDWFSEKAALAGLLTVLVNSFDLTRYAWLMLLLIWFEAPLATLIGEAYLGGAVFKQEKRLWQCVKEVFSIWQAPTRPGGPRVAGPFIPLFVCQMLMRGTLIMMLLPLFTYFEAGEFNPFLEVIVPLLLFFGVALLRAFRPYINEIIVLEKNPLRSRNDSITVGKRSNFLHGSSGGELFGQWLGSCIVAFVFMHVIFWSIWLIYGVMFGDFNLQGFVPQHILRPIALWSVVAYMGVARFLSYLDLRIRQEGWEVELLIRAEAARFTEKLV